MNNPQVEDIWEIQTSKSIPADRYTVMCIINDEVFFKEKTPNNLHYQTSINNMKDPMWTLIKRQDNLSRLERIIKENL